MTGHSKDSSKQLRSEGAEARTRLLDASLRLFAERGFAKTSTREIANAAKVNISSISYYFGDKAGLYKEVFNDPRTNPEIDPSLFADPQVPLRQALHALIKGLIDPLKAGDLMECCAKLHFREMLEPTGIWREEIDRVIRPAHTGLVALLCRHLDLADPDDDVHRLAFAISGLGVTLMVSSDPIHVLRPSLIADSVAIDGYSNRMADFAMAMFESERKRRILATGAATTGAASTQTTP
jgi:AcrR family transcriptional regulator